MYVAEIVLINQLKPPLNCDDKAKDKLTLNIDMSWIEWNLWNKPELLKKWRDKIVADKNSFDNKIFGSPLILRSNENEK